MQPAEGIFDNFLINLLKDAFDASKIDKAKLKVSVATACDAMKPATKFPADLDDKAWDMLKDAANAMIDKIGVQGPLVVGAAAPPYVESTREFSAATTDAFLATCEASESRKEYVRHHQRVMKVLHATKDGGEVFTDEDRRKIVGAFPWLMLIQLLGPLIINLIKEWLSK